MVEAPESEGPAVDVAVVDEAPAAADLLDPVRARILDALREPGSATTVAKDLGLSRQKVNYHMRTLEDHGLIRLMEERPRRGVTERILLAVAGSYLISPTAVGVNATDPSRIDRLSSRYLIALAARLIREVSALATAADKAGKPLPTLAIDTDIKFASPDDRAAFTRELGDSVIELAGRYHRESAPDGRWHRLVVAAHPFNPEPSTHA